LFKVFNFLSNTLPLTMRIRSADRHLFTPVAHRVLERFTIQWSVWSIRSRRWNHRTHPSNFSCTLKNSVRFKPKEVHFCYTRNSSVNKS